MEENRVAEKVTVHMSDGTTIESDSFVVVIDGQEITDTQLMYNSDVVLLGQAVQMSANAYSHDLNLLPEEERKEVTEALQSLIDVYSDSEEA